MHGILHSILDGTLYGIQDGILYSLANQRRFAGTGLLRNLSTAVVVPGPVHGSPQISQSVKVRLLGQRTIRFPRPTLKLTVSSNGDPECEVGSRFQNISK